MKLYSHPGSCSSAAHIALLEAGVPFEQIRINLRGDRKLPDGRDFSEINPKGYVPVLELDSGECLSEVVAILSYIADENPAAKLAPIDPLQRVHMLEWLCYINSEVHKGCSTLFSPDMPDGVKQTAGERLAMRLDYIDNALTGRDYLMGERFTVADAYLFIVLGWMPMLKFDLTPYKNFAAYRERIAGRAAVKDALAAIRA